MAQVFALHPPPRRLRLKVNSSTSQSAALLFALVITGLLMIAFTLSVGWDVSQYVLAHRWGTPIQGIVTQREASTYKRSTSYWISYSYPWEGQGARGRAEVSQQAYNTGYPVGSACDLVWYRGRAHLHSVVAPSWMEAPMIVGLMGAVLGLLYALLAADRRAWNLE